ncbi:MAG: spermidine synthase-like protein, partial [Desulfobulbaceae bacterium]|nr:spermidine synthase-like protein [Desulfobulbaceae bacterium]
SAALIGFQLEQMQLLAYVQWHHFAYLIISVALLGFGAGGTLIALFRTSLLRRLDILLPLLMFGCALLMALILPLTRRMVSGFDIYLLFVEPGQAGLLFIGQLCYLLIFLFGALPLGLVFIRFSERIGSLYCANLFGSGVGGITAVALMYFLPSGQLPALTALLPWCSGMMVLPAKRPRLLLVGMLSLAVIVTAVVYPPKIQPSQYKDLSRTLDMPGARVEVSQPSPYGLVQVVTAPALRYAPGLSLTFAGEVPEAGWAVFNNSDWFGFSGKGSALFLDSTLSALPYAIGARNKVLVLEAATGTDIVQALDNGAQKIVAVEPHRKAVKLIADRYGETDSNPLRNRAVHVFHLAPRTWLALDRQGYDLITLPMVGSFGGASGLFALQEQYLLTKEALFEIWNHLNPDGVLRISSWLDSPPRNALRLSATIVETLEEAGVEPHDHVAAVRSWDMITFIVKRSRFTTDEIGLIHSFCDRLQFDPVILPGLRPQEQVRYHFQTDTHFFEHLTMVFSPDRRQELYDGYTFNLRPVTDNRPFFSQFLRWQSMPHLIDLFGERTVPFLELGYVVVLLAFAQMAVAAGLLILLPLLRLGLPGKGGVARWTVPFFSGLGLGYMFFEVVLIHELILYFGHPVFAAAAGVGSLLIFSGVGSLLSGRFAAYRAGHSVAAALVALLLLVYIFILPFSLHHTIGLQTIWKIFFFLVLVAPPALVMGMPFPLGLGRLACHSGNQAAWAWGINGCVSVVSAGLAAIIAVELGFSAVMLAACLAYCLAALATWRS